MQEDLYVVTHKRVDLFNDNELRLRTAFQTREEGESTE